MNWKLVMGQMRPDKADADGAASLPAAARVQTPSRICRQAVGTPLRRRPLNHANIALLCALGVALLAGCSQKSSPPASTTPQQRYDAAKALFEKASREFHIPSAQARGAERGRLEDQAAAIYTDLARNYADQPIWAAQALRSLGNIHAARTNIDAAVKCYAQVPEKFGQQDFEVLMAWKSAGDLLSEARRFADAQVYYERLVARFDKPDALPIVQSVVRGAKSRLQGDVLLSAGNRE